MTVDTKDMAATVAYLIGVKKHILEGCFDEECHELLQNLYSDRDATVVRYLCKLRTTLLLKFRKTDDEMRYNQKNLDRTNSVIIWDNMLHYGTSNKMEIYAKRLSNLDTIIDINCNAQKTPILLKGTQQQRLSLLNAYEKYDGNQPVMFGTENFLEGNENAFTVFKTDCPYVADKLYELKVNLWNEALTYLGVASSVIQKKERMIKDEVNRLQGGVMANRYSRLNARQQACEEINRMFGTNMSVEFRDIFEQNKNSDTGSEGGMNE